MVEEERPKSNFPEMFMDNFCNIKETIHIITKWKLNKDSDALHSIPT